MKRTLITAACAMSLWLPAMSSMAQESDARQIEHTMKRQFDRPEAPLQVAPVTIVGHHAVAGWTQGARGGLALLHKDKAGWSISVCAGDGLLQARVLASAGVAAPQATQLARAVTTAEVSLPAAQRQLFASFEGLVKIEPGQAHAPAGHAGHPPAKTH